MNLMVIHSPEAMFELGKQLASTHKKILLVGELGAGKTTFSKGFAAGLGLDPDMVQSPTYTYMNSYEDKLLHIDMYRIEDPEQLLHLGLLDQIDSHSYTLIEWPKWEEQYIGAEWVKVEIEKIDEHERKLKLSDIR